MKKSAITGIITALGIMAFAIPAFAATAVTLSPSSLKVSAGQSFNVVVNVTPNGTKDYAEKIEVDYPSDTLEVSSFTLGNSGMALNQTGYDVTDNANGVLIKTAGYTSGVSSQTLFGTIMFRATKAGSGVIKIGGQSMAFQAGGQSAITGSDATFTVGAATVAPKAVSDTTTLVPVTTINGQLASSSASTTAELMNASNTDLTAAGAAASSGGSIWIWIIALVVILVIVWLLVRNGKKKDF